MNVLGTLSVFPQIPKPIGRLHELAYNLWWSWTPDAQALFSNLNLPLWDRLAHNPVKFLREVSQESLNQAATDPNYVALYDQVMAAFDAYMKPASTWFADTYPDLKNTTIAYFSAEFGLHEALPIYSGGLGVLSGDHCKAASDLGLPFIGIGFLYSGGYFTQRITGDGRQEATYNKIKFDEVPTQAAHNSQNEEVVVKVDLPGRAVYAKIWQIQVGRIPLFLMDTDIALNDAQDRELTARLYGGDNETRISQEIILGIGGVRAVRALGYSPAVWHMNEGHAAFLGLERIRELVQNQGLTFQQALEVTRASSVFTTHTPVPAGHDAFGFDMMDKYFGRYWGQLGVNREAFLQFARQDQPWGATFSMTVLAFRCSGLANGVSKLHGDVSRSMWNWLWPGTPTAEVPIDSITNGVHTETWLSPALRLLFDRYLGSDWRQRIDDPALWQGVYNIPDEELWQALQKGKERLFHFMEQRAKNRAYRMGEGPARLKQISTFFSPDTLVIGFARRFATYKRATMIFRDVERIKRLVTNHDRPVMILFSGKAHPADEPGKEFIRQICQMAQHPDFEQKVMFIEDYDMNIARCMVQGVDVWLNNPRRPREARGTSGEKAALNGCPNLSVLDGWWAEGYNGKNGWAIGEERLYKDEATQDEADALSLYTTLEDEVVPAYYQRGDDGIPHFWLDIVRASISSAAWLFSMTRMIKDYTNKMYVPAARHQAVMTANGYAHTREVTDWKQRVAFHWPQLRIEASGPRDGQLTVGEPVEIKATVRLSGLTPDEVAVEIVSGFQDGAAGLTDEPMQLVGRSDDGAYYYRGLLAPTASGQLIYGVRIIPVHADLFNKHAMALTSWA